MKVVMFLGGFTLDDYKQGDLIEVNKRIYVIEDIMTPTSCLLSIYFEAKE